MKVNQHNTELIMVNDFIFFVTSIAINEVLHVDKWRPSSDEVTLLSIRKLTTAC